MKTYAGSAHYIESVIITDCLRVARSPNTIHLLDDRTQLSHVQRKKKYGPLNRTPFVRRCLLPDRSTACRHVTRKEFESAPNVELICA